MNWEDISSLCFTKFLMGVFSLVKFIKDTIQARFIKGTELTIFSLHKISFMIQMKNFPLCYTSPNSLIQNNLILIWKAALVGKALKFEDYIFNIIDKVWKCQLLSHVQLFTTPWILACQAPLSMGIPQARILDWVAMSASWGSSRTRGQTCVSYVSWNGRAASLPLAPVGSLPTTFYYFSRKNICLIIIKAKRSHAHTKKVFWIPHIPLLYTDFLSVTYH